MPEVARKRRVVAGEGVRGGWVKRTGMYRIWVIVEDVSKRHVSDYDASRDEQRKCRGGETRERVDGKEERLNKWECLLSLTRNQCTIRKRQV